MRRIAVLNQKGGSAKTTTAVNLAASLACRGARVLLVDADPQASATSWLGPHTPPYLEQVLNEEVGLAEAIRTTRFPGLSILPASSRLAPAARRLAGQLGATHLLATAFRSTPALAFDFVLFDCPPELGFLASNVLLAADEVLIPVVMDGMALRGLAQVLDTLALIQERLAHPIRVAGILPVRFRGRTRISRAVVEELRSRFPELLRAPFVRESIAAAEAPSHRLPLIEYAPESHAALDYARLAESLHQESCS